LRSQISNLRFQNSDRFVLKNRWRQRVNVPRTHFEAHFSWDGDLLGLSQRTEIVIHWRLLPSSLAK